VRAQLAVAFGLIAVFAVAFAFLLPPSGGLSDEQYVAIAKSTREGQTYFAKFPATCEVHRLWTVQVSCDYATPGAERPEKFRVHIDRRTNNVLEVEAD
jgi:hypothetical protein